MYDETIVDIEVLPHPGIGFYFNPISDRAKAVYKKKGYWRDNNDGFWFSMTTQEGLKEILCAVNPELEDLVFSTDEEVATSTTDSVADLLYEVLPNHDGWRYTINSDKARCQYLPIGIRSDIRDGRFTSKLEPDFWSPLVCQQIKLSKAIEEVVLQEPHTLDPDGALTPLPTPTPPTHRYTILGYTPNKWGEHTR